jgi:hypothetical protein
MIDILDINNNIYNRDDEGLIDLDPNKTKEDPNTPITNAMGRMNKLLDNKKQFKDVFGLEKLLPKEAVDPILNGLIEKIVKND